MAPTSSGSSSGSDDEDLARFQSVAVSAQDISESARKQRAVAAARRQRSGRGAPAAAAAAEAGGGFSAGPSAVGGAHADGGTAGDLDLTSRKIAAALDAMLARQLDEPGGGTGEVAERPKPPPAPQPQPWAEAAAAGGDLADISGVRLFRRVAPGMPCNMRQEGEWGDAAATADGGSRPRRARKRLRELIPRLNLAAAASGGSAEGRARVLEALAVDGAALLAAAAAAATAAAHGREGGGGLAQAWERAKQRPQAGVVVEARPHVPHEARIAKLLGGSAAAAAAGGS